jgi:hypothetical protein
MTSALALYTYSSNPYVTQTLTNPFLSLPDTEKSRKAIVEGHRFRYYIPKIDDLLEVISEGKLHIFRGMIASDIFDLQSVSMKGETLISSLEKKGKLKFIFTKILADCGVDLESLALPSEWKKGLSKQEKHIISLSLIKSEKARRVGAAVIESFKHLKRNPSHALKKPIFRQITKYVPSLSMTKIIHAAMPCLALRPVVEYLVKKGANPNFSRNTLGFIQKIDISDDSLPTLVSAFKPARFPVTGFSGLETELPDQSASTRLHKATLHGFQENFLRSQLFTVFGISDFASTLDPLPRPQKSLSDTDFYQFFERIQNVVGYPSSPLLSSSPLFLTEHNLPISEEDWESVRLDRSRPIIIVSGWDFHATVVVIVEDKLYKGNRAAQCEELKDGIYCADIDRMRITPKLFEEITTNMSPEWFEYTLDLKLSEKQSTLYSELKPQVKYNCSWSSCAELSFYILHRHNGKTHEQAWILVKQMKAKVRHSFLVSYLKHDRTYEPHLHSAPLLGVILAKCLLRESDDLPEYSIMVDAILESGLSVDMLQLYYSICAKQGKTIETDLEGLKKRLKLTPEKIFEKLDPFFRKEEHHYKCILKAQDGNSIGLSPFHSNFNAIKWLDMKKTPEIPETYKVEIVNKLISPFYALILLASAEPETFSPSVKDALISVCQKAELSDPEDFISRYKDSFKTSTKPVFQIENIEYPQTTNFISSIILAEREAFSYPTNLFAKDLMKLIHELIPLILRDPAGGLSLTAHLLSNEDIPLRIKKLCSEKEVFPDGPLLRHKEGLNLDLSFFMHLPGWDISSKKRVLLRWIKGEPFDQQVALLQKFLGTLENEKPDEYLSLTDALIEELWKETPFIIYEVFSAWLELNKDQREALYVLRIFPRITEFLWNNDPEFMKSKLKEDINNAALWSKEIRLAIRQEKPLDDEILSSDGPEVDYDETEVYTDWILAKQLSLDTEERLISFLRERCIFPFNKRRSEGRDEAFTSRKKVK